MTLTPGEARVYIVVGYPLTRTIPEVARAVLARVASRARGREGIRSVLTAQSVPVGEVEATVRGTEHEERGER